MSGTSVSQGEFPQARNADDIARNVAAVRARIAAACARAGSDPADIRLLPDSHYWPSEAVQSGKP